MFVGHLAVALAAKHTTPKTPLAWLIGASFGLDLLWPILLLAGVERVAIDPGNTAFTPLNFESYPWSHSLLMVAGWAVIVGLAAFGRLKSAGGAVMVGALVLSHWVLDMITHRPDLPLWPDGPLVGLGLWNSVAGTLVLEGALLALGVTLYRQRMRARSAAGHWALFSLVAFTGIIWISGPWSPPPPHAQAIAFVGLAMWLFPLWGAWIDRHHD